MRPLPFRLVAFWAIFAFAVSATPAGEVRTPGIRDAECFSHQGSWRCDFEYHLKKKGPSYQDFPGGAPPTGFGNYGGSTGSGGSFCIHSQPGTADSYSYCGSSGMGSGWGDPSSWGWQAARGVITYWGHLPGQYSAMRGRLEADRLNQSKAAYSDYHGKITGLAENLPRAQSKYAESTLAPAVQAVVDESLKVVHETLQTRLLAPLEDLPKTEPPKVALEIKPPSVEPGVSVDITPQLGVIEERARTPREKWEALEPLWQIALQKDIPLPQKDLQTVSETVRKHFDANGILNAGVVGPEAGTLASSVSERLRSSTDTAEGVAVRYQMNRNLVAYAGATTDAAKEMARGGLALSLGADQAFADGKKPEGARLLKLAASAADFGLGFVPVLGSLNDLTQLAFGMVTGHDYAGNEMHAADYALRGVGAILGLVGAGAAGKAVVRFGANALDKSFALGANVLRRLKLGSKVTTAAKGDAAAAIEIARKVGEHPELLKGEVLTEAKISDDVLRAFDTGSESIRARHLEELSALERRAQSEGALVKRHGPLDPGPLDPAMASTFRSGSYLAYRTEEALTLYRVYGGKAAEAGQYWSRLKPGGRYQATLDFALDPNFKNTAAHWVEIKVPAGTMVYDGFAAPIIKEGQLILGGGPQTIIPELKKAIPVEWITGRGSF